jgi:hypothetical protein
MRDYSATVIECNQKSAEIDFLFAALIYRKSL